MAAGFFLIVSTALAIGANCEGWNTRDTRNYFQFATVGDIENCLHTGADPNARDRNGSTPLHNAAQSNLNPAVIEALLEAGADPNARDETLLDFYKMS